MFILRSEHKYWRVCKIVKFETAPFICHNFRNYGYGCLCNCDADTASIIFPKNLLIKGIDAN